MLLSPFPNIKGFWVNMTHPITMNLNLDYPDVQIHFNRMCHIHPNFLIL